MIELKVLGIWDEQRIEGTHKIGPNMARDEVSRDVKDGSGKVGLMIGENRVGDWEE